ncbi:MAG: T9SS type A sorting domain-containing protein [Ignavibacteriaceae bacterium]|nr:T9SS type A sorting domain-containing protein [Ignavibacteriaceae bacterium]
MLPTQTPNTQYGALLFNHVNDGSFYGNASDLQTFANTILNNIKLKQKPGFILAGYQRFRQEEFYSRPSPSTSDISLSRLNTLISYIKADPTVGNDVEVVTPELFSALMRKKLGISNIPNETDAPSSFALMQNYPNPFNPSTTICYAIAERQNVTMKVYDILGKEIVTLLNEEKDAGYYQIEFDAEKYSLASGVYFCELILNNNISKKIKIVYLK